MYYLTIKDRKTGVIMYYKSNISTTQFHFVEDIEEAKGMYKRELERVLKNERLKSKCTIIEKRKRR